MDPKWSAWTSSGNAARISSQAERMTTLVEDLPGGSARLTAASQGIMRVLVNGTAVVVERA